MIGLVNCVYRVSETAEMLSGQFDLRAGTICNAAWLFQIDLFQNYEYETVNYRKHKDVPSQKLYNLLCMFPKALVAINYNNIGAVVVFREKHSLYIFESAMYIKTVAFMESPFSVRTKKIGLVRTPIKTFEVLQPIADLVVDLSKAYPIIHTRFGTRRIDIAADELDGKRNLSRFLELCQDKEAYGSIVKEGKVRFVSLDKERFNLSEQMEG